MFFGRHIIILNQYTHSNDLLEDYYHCLDNDIQIFNSLRESFTNINTSFL